MPGWTLVGTGARTSFNYAEDASNFAGYCELNMGGPAGSGPIRIDSAGHIILNDPLPVTLAAGADAGGSPPAPVLVTGSNDCGGTLTFGTGTSPGAGIMAVVTFGSTWSIPGGGTPHIVICAGNAVTAPLNLYVGQSATTGFNVRVASAPAASQASSVYRVHWIAVG